MATMHLYHSQHRTVGRLDNPAMALISVAVLADISLRLPLRLVIVIILKKCLYDQNIQKNNLFNFEKKLHWF